MKFLIVSLLVLPAILDAKIADPKLRVKYSPDGDINVADTKVAFKEFAKSYVKIFTDLIIQHSPEAFQAHNALLDIEMMFNECHAPQYENYKAYQTWLEQFVAHHSDPKIKIQELKGDNEQGDMLLNVDVQALFKYRMNFDMRVSALNDNGQGWKILFVDRSIGCN